MRIFVFKLILTPALLGAVSLAAPRRPIAFGWNVVTRDGLRPR